MKTGRRADTSTTTKGAATMHPTRTRAAALAACLASLALASSCQQFFTTSLAPFLARVSYTIPADLPVEDAIRLLEQAMDQGDSSAAAALVTPLLAAATAAAEADPESAAYHQAASALLDAAVLSSGVSSAMTTLASGYLALGDEEPTGEQLATMMAAFSSVSLDDTAEDALLLLAAYPPSDMSSEEAYAAGLALMADGLSDAGSSLADMESLTEEQLAALEEDPSFAAAMMFLLYGAAIDEANGETSLVGGLLGGMLPEVEPEP